MSKCTSITQRHGTRQENPLTIENTCIFNITVTSIHTTMGPLSDVFNVQDGWTTPNNKPNNKRYYTWQGTSNPSFNVSKTQLFLSLLYAYSNSKKCFFSWSITWIKKRLSSRENDELHFFSGEWTVMGGYRKCNDRIKIFWLFVLLRNNKACSSYATLYYVAIWSPDKHNQRNRQATGMSGGLSEIIMM